MRRRQFIAGVGSAAAWSLAARAQQGDRVRRIGVLMSLPNGDAQGPLELAALRRGLAERGWIEGRTVDIAVRWPGGNVDLVEAFAKELAGAKPDVLLSRSTPTTAALQNKTRIIPIVMVNVIAPVEQRFVRSFARPGENITGFTNFEIQFGSKMLQLLKEMDPRIVRVGAIYNPKTAPYARLHVGPMEAAAAHLGVETVTMMVQSDSDIEAAITELARRPGGGLAVVPDTFLSERRDVIIGLVGRMRLPAVYGNLYYTQSGGLMAYAVDQIDTMYRAADYIDRILRGAQPADLPVQQPTKFWLAINMNAAKALGLTIPEALLATADEVIQ